MIKRKIKDILLFVGMLAMIFICDVTLFNVLWHLISSITANTNIPILRLVLIRLLSLFAIGIVILPCIWLTNKNTAFYIGVALTYILINIFQLLDDVGGFPISVIILYCIQPIVLIFLIILTQKLKGE